MNLTVMSLEIHTKTRANLLPDPDFDPIVAIFYSIYKEAIGCEAVSSAVICLEEIVQYLNMAHTYTPRLSHVNCRSLFTCRIVAVYTEMVAPVFSLK